MGGLPANAGDPRRSLGAPHQLPGRPAADHEPLREPRGDQIRHRPPRRGYCLERDIEFRALGAWTLEDKATERGAEPDECYVFGERRAATRPDLAIEVVWTSGGLRKLDIYRKLGVREVWHWRKGRISVHLLRGDDYVEAEASEALPGIDLAQLASFLDQPTTSAAIRGYRDALRG